MRVYNASPERIIAKYDGLDYQIEAGETISVTSETGNWIIERWAGNGLVDISVPEKRPETFDLRLFIVQKTLEGLQKYLETLHYVVEQFMEFDTELKQVNFNGTILKHKEVTKVTRKIEDTTRMISEIETKYGLSIARHEYEEKQVKLLASIEAQIALFDADEERQKKAKEDEAELNRAIKEVIPKEVLTGV